MKKIIKYFDGLVFMLTEILFSIIPVIMILGGSLVPISIILGWYFKHQIILSDLWTISIALLIIWMGFKWDDAVIKHYETSVQRKNDN